MTTPWELSDLIDEKWSFIGPRVTEAVRSTKSASVWRPVIERYNELSGENRLTVASRLYCDLSCTVVTKKVMMVDMSYLYDPVYEESQGVDEEALLLREAHMTTATSYLVKMFTCMYECVHGRSPRIGDAYDAAAILYADLYAESFDVTGVMEEHVFSVVRKWFCAHIFQTRDCAPGIPFMFCGHVYWLWLHLTAARVKSSSRDLLTVIYALDTMVYCDVCKKHFVDIRSEFFLDRWDEDTRQRHCYCRLSNAEVLLHLHNRVNARTGSDEMDAGVLSEYAAFWEQPVTGVTDR
ncbi:hypothetical protein J6590_097971 [Homalodisca vitripennis]|nr:hypothetical protein J6590_088232 [Homalodisca vitripennis]KAG8319139.1 hypothetical protein J6590_097971 [Homalodisca vitripennis]